MRLTLQRVAWLVVVAVLGISCGAGEPTGGTVEARNYTLVVTDEAARLAAPYDLLGEVASILPTFRTLVRGGGPVTIAADGEFEDGPVAEPGRGIGGVTNERGIEIVITRTATTALLEQHLPGLLAHEAHHWARRTSGLDRRETLAEKFFTEGMANRFVVELGYEVRREAIALTCEELQQEWDRALPVMEDETLAFDAWMFGGADRNGVIHPDLTAYAVGYQLAGAYLDATGLTAARAALVDANEAIERSGYTGGCFDLAEAP